MHPEDYRRQDLQLEKCDGKQHVLQECYSDGLAPRQVLPQGPLAAEIALSKGRISLVPGALQ